MLKRIFSAINSLNAGLVLIGLMFLLPFVMMYHQQPITSFYTEWIAAACGLAAMLALLRSDAWQPLHIPQISLVFAGLAAILVMQWMLGMLHSYQFALLVLSYLLWAFFLVVLGGYLRREFGWEKIATTLAWFLVVGGALNVAIVGLQYAVKLGAAIPLMPKLNGYGAIAQANHFANYMALATASLVYLYAKQQFKLKVFSVLLALFLGMLAFSGSRSSWLYLAALTVLAVGMQVNAMRQRTGSTNMRSLLRVSLLLLPAFVLAQLLIHFVLPNDFVTLPTERLVELSSASTVSARLHLWYDSLRLFLQSPWLGVGAGAMRAETLLLIDTPTAMASKRIFEHAHNLFLHLLAEMGIGAFLIVTVGLWAWLRAFKWRELNLETWWLLAMLAVLGIHSMLEYPLWFAYFLGIAAFLLGAGDEKFVTSSKVKAEAKMKADPQADAASDSISVSKTNSILGSILPKTMVSIILVVGIVNLSTLLIANIKLENWLMQYVGEDVSEQQAQLDWVHQHSLLAPYAELMYTISMAVNPSHIDDKVWLSKSAMRFKPMRRIAYQHVLLLKLQGDHAAAVKQLNRTLIAHAGDFKGELEAMPFKYWQDYLDVLSDARPILQQKSMQNDRQEKHKDLLTY